MIGMLDLHGALLRDSDCRIYSKIHRQITRHDWESPSLVFPHYMYIRMHMWWHIWLVNRGFDSFFILFLTRNKLTSIIFSFDINRARLH